VAVLAVGVLLAAAAGCHQSPKGSPAESAPSGGEPPALSVAVVKPERTTLRRAVRQPGHIQAFEQTPVFSKLAGYVRKWNVDIGDPVKKGDLLAELWVPEMEVDVKQKEALVQQAEAEIKQAKETAVAAEASLKSADAKVKEAESSRLRANAEYRRTKSQYERLARAGSSGVLDKESVEETRYGFEAAEAGLQEVEARVKSAQAARDESEAKLGKAKADVTVAEAHLAVAKENRDQAKTLLEYAKLTAPYDGMVSRRNVNTGYFVQPATGTKAEPLYVLERRGTVRVLVEVPEADAGWVAKGAQARVRVQALKGQEFTDKVARTSYALDRTTRTLVAEIDLPNPKDQLRPGMYVSATITTEHPDVMTLPASAVMTQGDVTQGYQSYCLLVVDGKARRTPIEVGARGTDRVEVLKKQGKPAKAGSEGAWEDLTGQEIAVSGNLSALTDGQAVRVAPGKN
jgi:multidrug efflux pump subunit AcrA (membrane-fusion protein)